MSTDWNSIRAQFPALKNWTYLNTATYGQLSIASTEAVARHFARRDELACSDFLTWFDDMDRIRGRIATLTHCAADDIAFVSNSSTAIGLLLGGMEWKPGDRVVTLKDEFPNQLYGPALLSRHGVEFVEAAWENFYASINASTRLVVISLLNYADGFRPPMEEIASFLHERGVLLYVDGTQGVGALQFDVRRVQPDVFAVHGYKWMLSPTGAGWVYVRPEVRQWLMPQSIGWRSHNSWRSVENLHHGIPEFSAAAEKYEGGMITFEVFYAMEAAVNMMLEIGPEAIERRVLGLADQCRELLRRAGGNPLPGESPIVCASFAGRDVSAIARELKERRVIVSARHGRLRVSTHFYNNEEDLAVLERELAGIRA